ncbi:MAG: sterol desaturase family protein [Chitinophagales bacterium]
MTELSTLILNSGLVALGTFIFMEGFAWWMHKYLLHGPLWFIHESHHRPRKSWWELNDVVSVLYGGMAAFLVYYGITAQNYWSLGIGLGISFYGVFYFLFHDVIIHRRIKMKYKFNSSYVNRLIRAHKMHHKHMQKEDSEAFGFLYAAPKYEVKKQKKRSTSAK